MSDGTGRGDDETVGVGGVVTERDADVVQPGKSLEVEGAAGVGCAGIREKIGHGDVGVVGVDETPAG